MIVARRLPRSSPPPSGRVRAYPAAGFRSSPASAGLSDAPPGAVVFPRRDDRGAAAGRCRSAAFTPGVRVRRRARLGGPARPPSAAIDYPPLVWIAAPRDRAHARACRLTAALGHDGGGPRDSTLGPEDPAQPLVVRRTSIGAYFAPRDVTRARDDARRRLRRAHAVAGGLPPRAARRRPRRALPTAATPGTPCARSMREAPRRRRAEPFDARTLWQRAGRVRDWRGKPVLAFMVNGAQGDDDEAHGGHFAIGDRTHRRRRRDRRWLVNNFYSLDVESEKGIIAAPVPLDNYLARPQQRARAGTGPVPGCWSRCCATSARRAACSRRSTACTSSSGATSSRTTTRPTTARASASTHCARSAGRARARADGRALAWLALPFVAIGGALDRQGAGWRSTTC